MSADPVFCDAARVARMIGLTCVTFRRHRARLEAEEGFPHPMPTGRRPVLWRVDQVRAWVERQGLPGGPVPAPAPPAPPEPGVEGRLLAAARVH